MWITLKFWFIGCLLTINQLNATSDRKKSKVDSEEGFHRIDNSSESLVNIDEATKICAIGYFQCNNSMQCIERKKNCDGEVDCVNGADEENCNDSSDSEFWDHFFRKRPAAKLDHIPLGNCSWSTVSNECTCRWKELHCQHKNLTTLPKMLPDDGISLLDLTGNEYPIIDGEFFERLTTVDTIVMKHCSIIKITSDAFQRFNDTDLTTLHLDYNQIKRIPENLFPPNNSLTVLNLAANQIDILLSKSFVNLDTLEELDLRENRLTSFIDIVFRPLKNLLVLFLNGNDIKYLSYGMLPVFPKLITLSLADNVIEEIAPDALRLPTLYNLFLSGNNLRIIKNSTFAGLNRLNGLNLNNNGIMTFESEAFNGVDNLTSLHLEDNAFRQLDSTLFEHLTRLEHIYFSWFHLCRAALHVRVCEPRGDGISSVHHLLDNVLLRISVWIMAIIAIVGNILVLLARFLTKARTSHHNEHSIYLRHLAASDLLMGIYLSIIAVVDISFRNEYLKHEDDWRRSILCSMCGFLSTLSCQSSTFLLTLVTWDRLFSVTQPLQFRCPSRKRSIIRLITLWGLCSALAAAPLSETDYFGLYFYGNNGVCLSLHIHDPFADGWEYSAIIFIGLNSFSLLFIVFAYIKMLKAIRGSGEAMRSTVNGRENAVARRFAVIVATDCACWLPIIAVKLAALAGVKISSDLYAWLAVLVLPVNSALNPILYTLTTPTFKKQVHKLIYDLSCGYLSPGLVRHQNGYESASISLNQIQHGTIGTFYTNSIRTKRVSKRNYV